MLNQKINPKYQKLTQLILNLLEKIQVEKINQSLIIQYLEAINKEILIHQTDKLIYNNLDNFDQVNDLILKNVQENTLNKKNIKIIINQYNKIIKNIKYKEKKFKKIAIATSLLAAIGFGTQFNKNDTNQIENIEPKQQITQQVEEKKVENVYEKYNISSKFYDNQKKEILTVLQTSQIKNEFLQHLNNLDIYNPKTNNLTPSNFNLNLFNYYKSLSKSENINFKLLIYITTVESSFGDERLSKSGALGPLQVMPATIKENCFQKYRSLFETDEQFYNDLGVQLKAGIYELQKIARGYNIDISENSNINNSDLVMLSASYNAGYGFFKKTPEQINNPTSKKGKEVYSYVRKVLTLSNVIQKIE